MVITDEIDFSDCGLSYKSGGFADVRPGQYNGRTVAVKTLRVTMTDDFDKTRKVRRDCPCDWGNGYSTETAFPSQLFCREAIIWNLLSHPNILKLVGVLEGFGEYQFTTVSEWMIHGSIMEYIRKYATNRLVLVCGLVLQGLVISPLIVPTNSYMAQHKD